MSDALTDAQDHQMPPGTSCPQASDVCEASSAQPSGASDQPVAACEGSDASGPTASGEAPPPGDAPSPKPEAPLFTVHPGRVMRVTAEEVSVELDEGRQGTVPLIEF